MQRRGWRMGIVLWMGLGGRAWAQEARSLTLAEALSAAVENNADLQDAERSVDAAIQGVVAARGGFDPLLVAAYEEGFEESESFLGGFALASTTDSSRTELGLSGELPTATTWSLTSRLSSQSSEVLTDLGAPEASASTIDNWQASVVLGAEQELLALLRPSAAAIAVRQAREQADQVTLLGLEVRQSVLARVATAWWTWESAWAQRVVAERAVAQAEETVRVTALWVEVGESERVELSRVQTELLSAQQALSRAHAEVDRTADALLLEMGVSPGTSEWLPAGSARDAVLSLSVEALSVHLERARTASPALARQQLVVKATTASAQDGRYSALPSLRVHGQVGLASLEEDASAALRSLTTEEGFPAWSVGATLSTPLGGRAASASRAIARGEVLRETQALEALERGLERDVRDALRQVEAATDRLLLAQAQLAVATETEVGEQARLTAGLRRTDQLLSARAIRQDAESDVLLAELERRRALVALALLEGRVEQALLPR